nr:hypothetical protein [Tanacetum cinerariifolium]
MEENATAGRTPSSVPMPTLPPSALNLPSPKFTHLSPVHTNSLNNGKYVNTKSVPTNFSPPPPSYAEDERSKGPTGLRYEMFVTQRSHIVQQPIGQAVGDMRMMSLSLMNPVSLVENHQSRRKNRGDDGTMIVVMMGPTLNKLSISPTGFPLQFLFSSPKIKKTSASIWTLELPVATLRQRFFQSIAPNGLAADPRPVRPNFNV